jgi:hypothetical protein
MSRVLAVIYVLGVVGLAVAAILIWRLRCENFGCIGVGVAWFTWVVVFLPVLATGAVLRSRPSLGKMLLFVTRFALWAQTALGVALLAVWVSTNTA